eukprot:CAMPEP_0182448270 /NCGR_PEP_ID=MMETSP1172-20130603/25550_1 /TAXON_ID=708627 /ORGANISM="Timspurckia oligopyrenoides, Strain CCMP3278" /LENGTH=255 /DNA_ID=CAMNT_0024645067 /DNA_START=382 /DNA_END=1149 /DNA_ORIENTATION=-
MNTSIAEMMRSDADRFRPQGICKRALPGYRKMNRVFVRLMFEDNSPLRQFEYWMRIDLDIRFHHRIAFDPFIVMKAGNFVFGYHVCSRHGGCQEGFPGFALNYKTTHNLTVTTELGEEYVRTHTMFYGNIGMGEVKFFTSTPVLNYLRAIDNEGGIWRQRWGDQHIYVSVIMFFSDANRTVSISKMLNATHKSALLKGGPCKFFQRVKMNADSYIQVYDDKAMLISDVQGFKVLESYGPAEEIIAQNPQIQHILK